MKKNIKTMLIALFVGVTLFTHSQDAGLKWAKRMGGPGDDVGHSIAVDDSGNVYTTGYFSGTVDFDPDAGTFNLTSAGGYDIFISKLNASGDFVWARRMGGSKDDIGTSVAVDSSGNVYTTGRFRGTVDFDPGTGTFNLTSAGDDIFISKLDASGNFVWAKQMGGAGNESSLSITLDGSGNIYTTGYFEETVDFNPGAGMFNLTSAGNRDIFISKLNVNGDFVWAKRIGNSSSSISDCGISIVVDDLGNVYTTGYFSGTVDFSPGPGIFSLASAGAHDIFISKLNINGDFVWAKRMGSSGYDYGYCIAVDGLGNVYTTGYFSGTVDFDPGAGTFNLTSAGGYDIFISKLNASGDFVWAKRMGSSGYDYGHCIAVDGLGNVYTTGYFSGTVDFDPGAGTFNLISAGVTDIFISKLNASGDFIWAKQMRSSGYDSGYCIAIDSLSNLYTTGYFEETVDFAPDAGTFNLASAGSKDIFIHKMSPCSPTSSTINETVCTSYTLNGTTYSATGVYVQVIPNINNCDSTITLNLTIGDVTAPVADVSTLPDITAECEVTSLTPPTATDNCTGSITGTHNVTLPLTTQGTTVVTWTYDDGNGNTSTQIQNVAINDVVAPVADVSTLPDIMAECEVTSLTPPTATDNCAGAITGTTTNLTLPITIVGTTVITWTYNDGRGNITTQIQNVVISGIDNTVSVSGHELTANQSGASYQWIDCDDNNAPLPGETAQTFTATANGNYAVIITSSEGCEVTSACMAVNSVGINELKTGSWNIYPNPVTNELNIELSEATGIRILDIAGKVIQTEELQPGKSTIDLGRLVSGTYLIQTTEGLNAKFVKE